MRYDFVKRVLDYWFVQRMEVARRSNLHALLIERDERKEEIATFKRFAEKYRKNLPSLGKVMSE